MSSSDQTTNLRILFSPFFSPIFVNFEKVKKKTQFLTGPNNLLWSIRIFFFSFEQKIIKKCWWNKLGKTGFVGSQFDLMCSSIFLYFCTYKNSFTKMFYFSAWNPLWSSHLLSPAFSAKNEEKNARHKKIIMRLIRFRVLKT